MPQLSYSRGGWSLPHKMMVRLRPGKHCHAVAKADPALGKGAAHEM
jgi:hypothetical protein